MNVRKFKIVIIGEVGVGKTSFFQKYCDGIGLDNPAPPTANDEVRHKNVEVTNNKQKQVNVTLEIYDTAGQEKFGTLTSSSYRHADGVLLCYDITNRSSFNRVAHWRTEVLKHAPNVSACVVGLKSDMEIRRVVSTMEGKGLADTWNSPFWEASTLTNTGLDECVAGLARRLVLALPSGSSTMRKDPSKKKIVEHKKSRCTIL